MARYTTECYCSTFSGIQKPAVCSLVIFFIVAFAVSVFQWPRNSAISVPLLRLWLNPRFDWFFFGSTVWVINTKDRSSVVKFLQCTLFHWDACFVLQNPFLLCSTYVFDYKLGLEPPGNNDRVYPFSWSIVIQSL